jgi:protein kinase-like protein
VHRYLYNELGILHRDISLNNILLRRVEDADEAVGLLIDYDYAELLLLEPEVSPESGQDAVAMNSGSETPDKEDETHIKTFRTVSFLFNLLVCNDSPMQPGHSTLHVHRSAYHRRSKFHSSPTS